MEETVTCRKCGHRAGYHSTTACLHESGAAVKRMCDCDGWERDPWADDQTGRCHHPAQDCTCAPCPTHGAY